MVTILSVVINTKCLDTQLRISVTLHPSVAKHHNKQRTGRTLASFEFAFQPAIERSRIDTLATCAWVRGAETVLIQGPPWVGKAHLAVGLGIKAVEQGFSAQCFRFDERLTEMRGDALLPPAQLRRRKYLSTALLVIDDLEFEPMNRQEASLFFRRVNYRYGRGSILITTNKSVRRIGISIARA